MTAWKGLLRKEWKLAKTNLFIGMVILCLVPIIIYTISHYLGDPAIFSSLMIGFVFAHIFYLPTLFLDALNKEGNSQLWLYNPNSMTKIIFAKFIPSFAIFFVSFIMTIIITFLATYRMDYFYLRDTTLSNETLFAIASTSMFSIIIVSVFLSLWVLFYWTIYHSLAHFPLLKKIRWLIILAILVIVQIFYNWLQKTTFYQKIIQLWVVKFKGFYFQSETLNQSFQFQISPVGATGSMKMMEISVMNGILQLFVALFLFYISIWLLERKVEV